MRHILRAAGIAAAVALTSLPATAQQTQIRGFSDVTYRAGSRNTAPNDFGLGQFDLYITSKLANNFHFLGESVFEYDEGFLVDVERVIITWSPDSRLNVGAGKHHTPIGYWNNAYHHGAVLQPTIERPLMFKFEDEGGVLPIHTTGLLLSGNDIGPAHLGYSFLVGNGIGSTPVADNNPGKSVTAEIRSQLTSYLEVGVSGYDDLASRGTLNMAGDSLPAAMRQRMLGAHIALLGSHYEFISEYQRVLNHMEGDGTHGTNAMYVYAGRRFGSFVPYLRYDRLDFAKVDPYFVPTDDQVSLVGARYDFSAAGTVKLEGRERKRELDKSTKEIVAQIAIGF
ncbi:MAG TPA: hypothetical protein VHM30_12410 [Gemmatimonadaceae bacterium]|nr:hypothetical protein [Gemmatimonadaceae bacterium]